MDNTPLQVIKLHCSVYLEMFLLNMPKRKILMELHRLQPTASKSSNECNECKQSLMNVNNRNKTDYNDYHILPRKF